MSISVREFELLNDNLFSTTWNDNHQSYLLLKDIRNACPCATCKAALKGFKKKIEVKNPECFELISVEIMGSYALKFKWGDGHDTGIYSFESLLALECKKD